MRKHGTVRRYLQGPDANDVEGQGCREKRCVDKHAAYLRMWRAKGARLLPVPELIRRRLENMVRGDWTYWSLSQELGLGHQTLRHIIEGTTKRIRLKTLEKLAKIPELVE